MYDVIVKGDTSRLRASIEGMATLSAAPLEDRIEVLDKSTSAVGFTAYFGEEAELGFRDANDTPLVNEREELYEDVVLAMQRYLTKPVAKGQILRPAQFCNQILVNKLVGHTYNPDQPDCAIIEPRTTPGRAIESTNRYWNLMGAVGRVASGYDFSADILATHINATVFNESHMGGNFINFKHPSSANLLATIQNNLAALYSLEAEAGLDTGIAILEAYPTKDASTAMHGSRIELRHPTVGVVNPLIDKLAILSALNSYINGTIPDRVRKTARQIQEVYSDILPSYLVYADPRSKRLVLPAQLNASAYAPGSVEILSLEMLTSKITDKAYPDVFGEDEDVLRRAIAAIRVDEDQSKLYVDRSSLKPHEAKRLAQYVNGRDCMLGNITYRVGPHILSDSPERNERRRANIARSSTARAILGPAIKSLTPAAESARIKREFLKEFVRQDTNK